MNRTEKQTFVGEFREKIRAAPVLYLTDFSGLDVKSMTLLRRRLKDSGAEYLVVKNRLVKLAVADLDLPDISEPIQPESARAQVLASLASVDLVVGFAEDTPMALIEALRPDVLVKGADYGLDEVVGADLVQSYGGRVVLAELAPGHSTTTTISRIAR